MQPMGDTKLPLALVKGQPYTELPQDLYIPPDALQVFLETFQGPLDLLLYLIKRQNLDILNIRIAEITRQYISYINLMQELRLELAAEYLVMAALLAEIKSRLLLPRSNEIETEEMDPRAELVRRLIEYEKIKQAANELEQLPQLGREVFWANVSAPMTEQERPLPQISLDVLIDAFKQVLQRVQVQQHHQIQLEPLSVRERMSHVLAKLSGKNFINFTQLFTPKEGKMGVVVTFVAILELLKQSLIEIVQNTPFSPLHVKAVDQ